MTQHLVLAHALTPVHVGIGQGVGDIDLPTARERATQHPYVPGSGFKGVARERARTEEAAKRLAEGAVRRVFGEAPADTPEDAGGAGSVIFSDLRLACLPVRSYFGTLAWISSPFVLRRLARDVREAGIAMPFGVPTVGGVSAAVAGAPGGGVVAHEGRSVWLEDFHLSLAEGDAAGWAGWLGQALPAEGGDRAAFVERFLVVHDDVFDYLCETALEVRSRVRLEEATKVAADSGSWLEESIPAESILAGLVQVLPRGATTADEATRVLDHVLGSASGGVTLQVGGKASVGLGRVRAVLAKGVDR